MYHLKTNNLFNIRFIQLFSISEPFTVKNKVPTMGILIKLYLNDSKEHLNLSVQDYDKSTEKCKKTILDIMVPLVVQSKHVSDIDDCTDNDLLNNHSDRNSAGNNLETVLGDELGIEISNITGNAHSFTVIPSKNTSQSPLTTVVSMTKNCSISDNDEKELNTDFDELGDDKNENKAINITTEIDEDVILKTIENRKNNTEAQNNFVITETHSVNEHQSTFTSTAEPCRKDSQENLRSQIVLENSRSESQIGLENERSNCPEEKQEESDECEFIVEEIMDLDGLQEIDRWSVNDGSEENDEERVVDLTAADHENVDLRTTRSVISTDAESCCEADPVVTLNDFSDDDGADSEYSSARHRSPRRIESDDAVSSFGDNFVPLRRALSNPPENSVEIIHDDYETRSDGGNHVPQVVDLTYEKKILANVWKNCRNELIDILEKRNQKDIECVDLTNDRKSRTSSVVALQPIIIERSAQEVMEDLKNFYKSNKDIIKEKRQALVAFGEKYNNKRRGGIEAPPKLSNGLGWLGKRCRDACHDDSEVKFSRVGRSSSFRGHKSQARTEVSSHPQGKSLNKIPIPTRGPSGFHINDDLGDLQIADTAEENVTSDPTDVRPIPSVLSFRGSRRGMRNNRFNARSQRNWGRRFNQHYISPLRRQNYTRNSTERRGEVWMME